MAERKPTDFKEIVENAQREVASWPQWMRDNRDASHVPVRQTKETKEQEQSPEDIEKIRGRAEEIYLSDEVRDVAHKLWLGREDRKDKHSKPDHVVIDRDEFKFVLKSPRELNNRATNRFEFTRITPAKGAWNDYKNHRPELRQEVTVGDGIVYITETPYRLVTGQEAINITNQILDSFVGEPAEPI